MPILAYNKFLFIIPLGEYDVGFTAVLWNVEGKFAFHTSLKGCWPAFYVYKHCNSSLNRLTSKCCTWTNTERSLVGSFLQINLKHTCVIGDGETSRIKSRVLIPLFTRFYSCEKYYDGQGIYEQCNWMNVITV